MNEQKFNIPFRQWVYLTQPWYIKLMRYTGNISFLSYITNHKHITSTRDNTRYDLEHISFAQGVAIQLRALYMDSRRQDVQIAIQSVTKSGKPSKKTCWIGISELLDMKFQLEPTDLIDLPPLPSEEPEDRFRELDI